MNLLIKIKFIIRFCKKEVIVNFGAMKQQETHTVKEKTKVKPLPGNIKIIMGKSMVDKFEYAKAASAGSKGFKN